MEADERMDVDEIALSSDSSKEIEEGVANISDILREKKWTKSQIEEEIKNKTRFFLHICLNFFHTTPTPI